MLSWSLWGRVKKLSPLQANKPEERAKTRQHSEKQMSGAKTGDDGAAAWGLFCQYPADRKMFSCGGGVKQMETQESNTNIEEKWAGAKTETECVSSATSICCCVYCLNSSNLLKTYVSKTKAPLLLWRGN